METPTPQAGMEEVPGEKAVVDTPAPVAKRPSFDDPLPEETPTQEEEKDQDGEKKEPEVEEPKKDDAGETDELEEIFVKDSDGKMQSLSMDKVLENVEVQLKVSGKLHTIQGFDKLKELAQIGFHATEKNTRANEVFKENQMLREQMETVTTEKAKEMAKAMLDEMALGEEKDPNAEEPDQEQQPEGTGTRQNKAILKRMELLEKELQQSKSEKAQQEKRESEVRWRMEANQRASASIKKTLEPYQDRFKDESGKLDEKDFAVFVTMVADRAKSSLTQVLEDRRIAEPGYQISQEEIEEELSAQAKHFYNSVESLVEKRVGAKIKTKTSASGAPPVKPTSGFTPTSNGPKKRLNWDDALAGGAS